MSNKKKNYNNYNKMSTEPKVEEVNEEIVETVSEVEETKEDASEVVTAPNEIYSYGVVFNCEKLKMRSEPNKQSDVVCILNKGDKVKVGRCEADFYEVAFGEFKGFCMKEFIEIK